jgi:hypothetical protein
MANRSDLARWESAAGAGYDAAGRTVYTGPGMMYMGPGDNAATKAVHQGLVNDTNMDDGEGLIRALLAERNRNAARNMGVDPAKWLQLQQGGAKSFTYSPNYSVQK